MAPYQVGLAPTPGQPRFPKPLNEGMVFKSGSESLHGLEEHSLIAESFSMVGPHRPWTSWMLARSSVMFLRSSLLRIHVLRVYQEIRPEAYTMISTGHLPLVEPNTTLQPYTALKPKSGRKRSRTNPQLNLIWSLFGAGRCTAGGGIGLYDSPHGPRSFHYFFCDMHRSRILFIGLALFCRCVSELQDSCYVMANWLMLVGFVLVAPCMVCSKGQGCRIIY